MRKQKLADAIDKSDMTKKEFAAKLNVTVECIYHIIGGVRNPSIKMAAKMCELLNNELKISDIRNCTKHCYTGCPCSQK